MKKLLFLVLALLMPVVIYLFLQSFGDNQYMLPIMHSEAVPSFENCETASAPYKLPAMFYEGVQHKAIIVDVRLGDLDRRFINNELARVRQYFGESVFTYKLFGQDIEAGVPDQYSTKTDLQRLAKCTLLSESNNSFITLVDNQGRIRGYYDSSKKQEFDRMITEIEILNAFE